MTSDPNFNPIARPYRWLEYVTLGRALKRCRLHFLPALLNQKRALVIGDGDGRFLAALMASNPHIHADAVDTSATMLQLLSKRCEANATRLETHHTSALTFAPTGAYDLVVTHFFLDCLTQPELQTLAQNLAANTAPGTLWLLSDFAVPATPILRPLAALYIRSLYLAFRILTNLRITHLPDPQSALAAAGFTRIARHELLCGILYTEIWQLH